MARNRNAPIASSRRNEIASITTATAAALSLWIRIDTNETTTSTVYDTVKVQVVDGSTTTTLATYSNLNAATGYAQKTLTVTGSGSTTVTFSGVEGSQIATSFVLDDVTLTPRA